MADLLQKSSAWLEDQRVKHLTQMVVYQRGTQTGSVAATIGSTVFQLDDGNGAVIRSESRDYLIRAADLVLDGAAVLPQRGDQIRETDARTEAVVVYEVTVPGDSGGGGGGEPCWRWSDGYRQTLRVHTQQVDMETTP